MSLQRQHFPLSYLKTLSVDLAGFEPVNSRSADRRSPNRSNQAAIINYHGTIIMVQSFRHLGDN